MKRTAILATALLLAACGGKTVSHSISAVIEADPEAGNALLTCRESSSSSCHVLFVTGKQLARVEAKVGATATAGGLTPDTQFCLQENAPQNGCRLQPLVKGEQIVRSQATYRE